MMMMMRLLIIFYFLAFFSCRRKYCTRRNFLLFLQVKEREDEKYNNKNLWKVALTWCLVSADEGIFECVGALAVKISYWWRLGWFERRKQVEEHKIIHWKSILNALVSIVQCTRIIFLNSVECWMKEENVSLWKFFLFVCNKLRLLFCFRRWNLKHFFPLS